MRDYQGRETDFESIMSESEQEDSFQRYLRLLRNPPVVWPDEDRAAALKLSSEHSEEELRYLYYESIVTMRLCGMAMNHAADSELRDSES